MSENNKAKESEEVKEEQVGSEQEAKQIPKTESQPAKKESKSAAVPKEFAAIVEQLDKLSALEVSKFVKFLEEHWNVSAAAPAAVMAAPVAGADGGAPATEEKSEFDVTLKDPGAQKVAVIKAVKDITNLGLGEAKAIVDGAPKVVLEKASKEDADSAKATLEAAGATVELA